MRRSSMRRVRPRMRRGNATRGWSGASRTRPSPRACPGEGRGQPRGGAFRQPEETQPEKFGHPGARQFGYTKVRYRGLAKNTAQVMVLIGLANLYAVRRRLMTA